MTDVKGLLKYCVKCNSTMTECDKFLEYVLFNNPNTYEFERIYPDFVIPENCPYTLEHILDEGNGSE